MEIRARPSASMRLDMSRPVLITHLAPRAWRSPMRDSTDLGIGGFSNSENSVPSKSVEINWIGALILIVLRVAYCVQRAAYARQPARCNPHHASLALGGLPGLACRNE